ncbi:hypothetical protein KY330_04010 [Candidatus Woesearchaeota archaeon]|nr:hypothetical protein [Candidatus Woesearchaeota archaeon]
MSYYKCFKREFKEVPALETKTRIIWVANNKKRFEEQYNRIKEQLGGIIVEHSIANLLDKTLQPYHALVVVDSQDESMWHYRADEEGVQWSWGVHNLIKNKDPELRKLLINDPPVAFKKHLKSVIEDYDEIIYRIELLPEVIRCYL